LYQLIFNVLELKYIKILYIKTNFNFVLKFKDKNLFNSILNISAKLSPFVSKDFWLYFEEETQIGVTYILINFIAEASHDKKKVWSDILIIHRNVETKRLFERKIMLKSSFVKCLFWKVAPCLCNYIRRFDYCVVELF